MISPEVTWSSHGYTTMLMEYYSCAVVLRWSVYGSDMVWSAKRIHFTPAEQLSVIMLSTKRQLMVKLMEEEEDLLLTAAYLQLQIMKLSG